MEESAESPVLPVAAPAAAPDPMPAAAVSAPAEPSVPASTETGPRIAAAPVGERPLRGLLFALPVVPVGVYLWVLLWQLGYMSAIVMFAVSAGAAYLYRRGAGGRISPVGLWIVIGLTALTLVVAFLGGIAADIAEYMGISMANALGSSRFWAVFTDNVFANGRMWQSYTTDILFALLFAALGTLGVFRRVVAESRRGR